MHAVFLGLPSSTVFPIKVIIKVEEKKVQSAEPNATGAELKTTVTRRPEWAVVQGVSSTMWHGKQGSECGEKPGFTSFLSCGLTQNDWQNQIRETVFQISFASL